MIPFFITNDKFLLNNIKKNFSITLKSVVSLFYDLLLFCLLQQADSCRQCSQNK